jgi:hypothetical protein
MLSLEDAQPYNFLLLLSMSSTNLTGITVWIRYPLDPWRHTGTSVAYHFTRQPRRVNAFYTSPFDSVHEFDGCSI